MPEWLKGQDLRCQSFAGKIKVLDFKINEKSCGLVPTEVQILLPAYLLDSNRFKYFKTLCFERYSGTKFCECSPCIFSDFLLQKKFNNTTTIKIQLKEKFIYRCKSVHVMNTGNSLNHHSATVLPVHVDLEGTVHLILEEKDESYKLPFFDKGLNFLGGNWEKGVHNDESPLAVVRREIDEEFWTKFEPTESLNGLLGQTFLDKEPEIAAKYDYASVQKIRRIASIICADMRYFGSFLMRVNPPIAKTPLTYGSSIFTSNLSIEQFKTIEEVLKEFDGKITTDNLKWGSHVVSTTLQEINLRNRKFAWGYCHIINELMKSGYSFLQPGVIRPLNLIEAVQMKIVPREGSSEARIEAGPAFREFEDAGYEYHQKVRPILS